MTRPDFGLSGVYNGFADVCHRQSACSGIKWGLVLLRYEGVGQ